MSYLKPITVKPAVTLVVERLMQAIISGELKRGEKLPTVTELCRVLNVGHSTVREALKTMESFGILDAARGVGMYVARHCTEKMMDAMIYWMNLEGGNGENIRGLRFCLNLGILYWLTYNISPEYIAKMKKNIAEMKEIMQRKPIPLDEFLQTDLDFHALVYEAVENPMIMKIGLLSLHLSRENMRESVEMLALKGGLDAILDSHIVWVKALSEKRGDKIYEILTLTASIW